MATPSKAPVGVATQAGLVTAVLGFAGALAAAAADRTADSAIAAVVALGSLLTVLGGRYAQAVVIARRELPEASQILTDLQAAVKALESSVKS